jgi:hypothetical protein
MTTKLLVTAGSDKDLTEGKPLREIVIQHIIDSWDTSFSKFLPKKNAVHFRLWFSGIPGLHIAAADLHARNTTRALGSMPGLIVGNGIVLLDLFAMSVNCCQYPPELAAACAFIEKLVETDSTGLQSKGINHMQIFSKAEEREQDPTSAVFHYSIQIECVYAKSAVEITEP